MKKIENLFKSIMRWFGKWQGEIPALRFLFDSPILKFCLKTCYVFKVSACFQKNSAMSSELFGFEIQQFAIIFIVLSVIGVFQNNFVEGDFEKKFCGNIPVINLFLFIVLSVICYIWVGLIVVNAVFDLFFVIEEFILHKLVCEKRKNEKTVEQNPKV